MVSLTQMLAWDLPLDNKIRDKVAEHAHDTMLGTVSLVENERWPAKRQFARRRRRHAALQLSRPPG